MVPSLKDILLNEYKILNNDISFVSSAQRPRAAVVIDAYWNLSAYLERDDCWEMRVKFKDLREKLYGL